MLGWRLAVSAFLIPTFIGLCWWDARCGSAAPVLGLLCLAIAMRSSWELCTLLRVRSFDPVWPVVAAGSCLVVLAAWWPRLIDWSDGNPGAALNGLAPVALVYAVTVLGLLAFEAARFRESGRSMERLGASLLVVSYAGVLLSITAQLRWVTGTTGGYLALGSLVIAAKCGDVGAYTLGRLFGRTKLIPRLSPGKTRVGGLGALLGAALGSVLWFQMTTSLFDANWSAPPWGWSVLFGVVIGAVGLVGDLCESLIKRDVQVKDSAALMPGFGGLLDLLDSVLYAGPVAYLLWLWLPLAPR